MNRSFLCIVWIGSALAVGFLLSFFTMSCRTRILTDNVNNTLASIGGSRIELYKGYNVSLMDGTWFSVKNSADKAFVFTMLHNGIGAACVALVDAGGNVSSILPLSDNARQITEKIPLPVYRFYADRIENDAKNRMAKAGEIR